MNTGIILTAVLLPLVLSEVGEVSPWLARCVLRWGARCIGDADATERYTEEWLAGIEDTPGKLIKLLKALGIILSAVPALHWRSRKLAYKWLLFRTVDALMTFVAPSLSRKLRKRRINGLEVHFQNYQFRVTTHEVLSTIVEMLKCLTKVAEVPATRFLPEVKVVHHGSLKMMIEYKQRRVVFAIKDTSDRETIQRAGFRVGDVWGGSGLRDS